MKFLSTFLKRLSTPRVHPDIIKEVQTLLDIPSDGVAGSITWSAISTRFGLGEGPASVESVQRYLEVEADGVAGPKTWHAILKKISEEEDIKKIPAPSPKPKLSPGPSLISKRAYDLILKYEVGGGIRYYNKALKSPTYPGGQSGVTIGIGYDLGYNDLAGFTKDWGSVLDEEPFYRLADTLGKKGSSASKLIPSVKDISISWQSAETVFNSSTLPRFVQMTQKAFPGSEKLSPDTFGALVSIVFNRGASISGSSRVEMKNIRDAISGKIVTDNLNSYIANQIVSMKRLWKGKGLDGLLTRRDAEAELVRRSS
jgi:hypothetical protein